MKKIVVVSDSHGDSKKISRIIKAEQPFDIIIHSGDGVQDLRRVQLPEGSSSVAVLGNVDVANGVDGDRIAVEEVGDFTLMVSHGDQYGVKIGLDDIRKEASKFGADVVVFGHVHQQIIDNAKPVLFNPGDAAHGFYGIIEVSERIYFSHRKLPEKP